MSYEEDSELNEIKQKIDQKFQRRVLLGAHAILWFVGLGILSILDVGIIDIVAVTWLGLVLFHGLMVLMWEKRDRDVEAEVQRRAAERGSQKLKRDRLYRLSDDGELVEAEDEDGMPNEVHYSSRN